MMIMTWHIHNSQITETEIVDCPVSLIRRDYNLRKSAFLAMKPLTAGMQGVRKQD